MVCKQIQSRRHLEHPAYAHGPHQAVAERHGALHRCACQVKVAREGLQGGTGGGGGGLTVRLTRQATAVWQD